MDAMGLGPESVCILHIGGMAGGRRPRVSHPLGSHVDPAGCSGWRCWRPRHKPAGAAAAPARARHDRAAADAAVAVHRRLRPRAAPIDRQRGVALGLFAEDVSFSYGSLLAEIVALGATHVALVVPLYQTDATAHDIGLHTRYLADAGRAGRGGARRQARRPAGDDLPDHPPVRARPRAVARHARAARSRRLVQTLRRPAGRARPRWRASPAPRGWSVGSELSTLEDDLDHWRPVVERVRAIFPGKLVYSANWDHYRRRRLYDLVDEEGVSAYFNLREASAPADDATLDAGWRRARRDIEAWRVGRTHPFVFTELGYRSRKGVTASPWDEAPGGTPDLDEQRRAFASFRRVWADASVARRRLRLELVRLRRPGHHRLHPARQTSRGRGPRAPGLRLVRAVPIRQHAPWAGARASASPRPQLSCRAAGFGLCTGPRAEYARGPGRGPEDRWPVLSDAARQRG